MSIITHKSGLPRGAFRVREGPWMTEMWSQSEWGWGVWISYSQIVVHPFPSFWRHLGSTLEAVKVHVLSTYALAFFQRVACSTFLQEMHWSNSPHDWIHAASFVYFCSCVAYERLFKFQASTPSIAQAKASSFVTIFNKRADALAMADLLCTTENWLICDKRLKVNGHIFWVLLVSTVGKFKKTKHKMFRCIHDWVLQRMHRQLANPAGGAC